MNRRSAIAILVSTAALVMSTSSWAQGNGNGNDGGNGNGNGNDGSNGNVNANGHHDGNAGDNGNGHDKGNDGSADTNGNGKGNGQGRNTEGSGNPTSADDKVELSESEVLAAVQAGSAVSLETLLPDVRTRTGGEIIDAQLQQARGFLLYAVTVLTPGGKVVTEYYYARSGIHVGN
ncbi:hypothetical protein ABIB57_004350 [Devosia sp. UYZn731]|uniref:PepSY domain-containing protein n=1 Tax=Devosia sp. UYZn731 TaxID=3156345 RepID=UPI00339B7BBE